MHGLHVQWWTAAKGFRRLAERSMSKRANNAFPFASPLPSLLPLHENKSHVEAHVEATGGSHQCRILLALHGMRLEGVESSAVVCNHDQLRNSALLWRLP